MKPGTEITTVVYEGPIAGVSYGHFKFRPDRIRGRNLVAAPMPENEYDPKAIAIKAVDGRAAFHVGYVPRSETKALHKVLAKGGRLTVEALGMKATTRYTNRGTRETVDAWIRVTTTERVKPKTKPLNPAGTRRLILA